MKMLSCGVTKILTVSVRYILLLLRSMAGLAGLADVTVACIRAHRIRRSEVGAGLLG